MDKEVINILKSGDLAEYQRQIYKLNQQRMLPQLLKFKQNGDWEEFCDYTITHYEVMPIAFEFFEELPDNMKYQFLIDCYDHHGDELQIVRKYVEQMRQWGAPELPHCCQILDTLVIYRAGTEDIEASKKRISWTLDVNVARFFYKRSAEYETRHIYQGFIKINDVLAYNNNRLEQEIMQYNKVHNITEVTQALFQRKGE